MRLLCHLCHIQSRHAHVLAEIRWQKAEPGREKCQPQSVLAIPEGRCSVANRQGVALLPCPTSAGGPEGNCKQNRSKEHFRFEYIRICKQRKLIEEKHIIPPHPKESPRILFHLSALVWGHPSADVSKGLCSFTSAPPFAGCGLSCTVPV